MSNSNWTLHHTPYGTVAATVNSKGGAYLTPAYDLITRYPNDPNMRYTAPRDEAIEGDTETDAKGNTQAVEPGTRAALTVNGKRYEHATIDVEAQHPNEYVRSYRGDGPHATARSSYLAELTDSARAKLQAMAVELYPTVATPVRVAQAVVRQAEYENTAAQKAYHEAEYRATNAYRAVHEARNALINATRTEAHTNSTESE